MVCEIFNLFWNHFHSWNTLSTSLCSYFPVLDILHFTEDGSGCPFANLLIDPWLKFDPSAIEQFWLHAELFTDAWAMTYFCTAACSLLVTYRLLEAKFQQYFCWATDFLFQQVVMRVCGELQCSSVVHVLHCWFSTYGNCQFFRTLQPGSKILQWRQTEKKLGINRISCRPIDSGSIATVGLYRTICKWGTAHCVVLV